MLKILIAATVGLALAGCGTLAAPHTPNDALAYAGGALKSVEQMAAAEYKYMSKAKVNSTRALIRKAERYQDQAVSANKAGDEYKMNSKLGQVGAILNKIQSILHEARHEQR
jgi:uncharacterized protein YceK